jgi:hypothetical protein
MKNKIKRFLEVTQFYEMATETIVELLKSDEVEGLTPEVINSIFDITEIEETIIPLYESKFTEQELDSILAFFNTHAGTKMLTVNSELSDSINYTFNEWITKKYSEYIEQH